MDPTPGRKMWVYLQGYPQFGRSVTFKQSPGWSSSHVWWPICSWGKVLGSPVMRLLLVTSCLWETDRLPCCEQLHPQENTFWSLKKPVVVVPQAASPPSKSPSGQYQDWIDDKTSAPLMYTKRPLCLYKQGVIQDTSRCYPAMLWYYEDLFSCKRMTPPEPPDEAK